MINTSRADQRRPPSVPRVTAVERAARILQAVADADAPLTAAKIARDLELPRSTALGLCVTLADTGLLERIPSGEFRLGPRLIYLSQRLTHRFDLVDEFQATCAELDVLPAETFLISIRDGQHIVSIGQRPGATVFGVDISIGRRVPAHATAMGKAMLSTLADDELTSLYRGSRTLEKLTDKTIPSYAELLDEINTVRINGYAIDDEETARGLLCIGAPVSLGQGERSNGTAAVAVALVKGGLEDEYRHAAISAVQSLAKTMSERVA